MEGKRKTERRLKRISRKEGSRRKGEGRVKKGRKNE